MVQPFTLAASYFRSACPRPWAAVWTHGVIIDVSEKESRKLCVPLADDDVINVRESAQRSCAEKSGRRTVEAAFLTRSSDRFCKGGINNLAAP